MREGATRGSRRHEKGQHMGNDNIRRVDNMMEGTIYGKEQHPGWKQHKERSKITLCTHAASSCSSTTSLHRRAALLGRRQTTSQHKYY